MAQVGQAVLEAMLDRLMAGLLSGPGLNCRPHNSRQRIDLAALASLQDINPTEILKQLLSPAEKAKVAGRAAAPPARLLEWRKRKGADIGGESAPPVGMDVPADTAPAADPAANPLSHAPTPGIEPFASPPHAADEAGDPPFGPGGAAMPQEAHAQDEAGESEPAPADVPPHSAAAAGHRPTADVGQIGDRPTGNARPDEADREEKRLLEAWMEQQAVFTKVRNIVEDARTYEQDTGAHVLSVGFPLLSIAAGTGGSRRRILAPLAFVPVDVTVTRGANPSIALECHGAAADRVTPNDALLAWLEQQQKASGEELYPDAEGQHPWREIASLVKHVAEAAGIALPSLFAGADVETGQPDLSKLELTAAPRSDAEGPPAIIFSAVLGLFPMANQGLIRDTKALVGGEALHGPVASYVDAGAGLAKPKAPANDAAAAGAERAAADTAPVQATDVSRNFADERLVSEADPFQGAAVRLARTCSGLVVHGPPGTGKSQTITNIIGDHLARGERILMVCDKRTALDVVCHRLEHLGLGSLCAIVHDPQRDQRNFYKSVRAQIDALADAKFSADSEKRLKQADAELTSVHGELHHCWNALMKPPAAGEESLHELIGRWLALPEGPVALPKETETCPLDEFEAARPGLGELFRRALDVDFAHNPWVASAGASLKEFLRIPAEALRKSAQEAVEAARKADAAADSVPPFSAQPGVLEQAALRAKLADALEKGTAAGVAELANHWSKQDARTIGGARRKLADVAEMIGRLQGGRLDTELMLATRGNVPTLPVIAQRVGALEAYLQVALSWHAFMHFSRKKAAARALAPFGLSLGAEPARRALDFLKALRERLILAQVLQDLLGKPAAPDLPDDDVVAEGLGRQSAALELLGMFEGAPALAPLRERTISAIGDGPAAAALAEGLRRSTLRAERILAAMASLKGMGVLSAEALGAVEARLLAGERIEQEMAALAEKLDTLEGVVRAKEAVSAAPAALRGATGALVNASADADTAVLAIRKAVLKGEVSRRLERAPELHAMDAHHVEELFARRRQLSRLKKTLVRDDILRRWTGKQKERLVASTGSRLNSAGAELRRRFMLNGERAMRLRKVVELGAKTPEGDALFDLRPVWMASPETVAQVFPREAVFDVVVFDEASQCRLEEALPVLLRAKRVVVAGDQKQLPPTRFFESAAVASEEKGAETDQELFEAQQGETEDLLSASLNMEIQESHLDVHYRSRNADLVEFSNRNFYNARLQAIPAHPRNRTRFAPLTLEHVNGVYDKSANEAEALRVCQIVRDLLKRSAPPSIGIACFNVVQRDLILERLDDLVAADAEFARRLAQARSRVGKGSFEGLFVKNLENVQGDERDHMIISTTYGPDARGKFYRRFGPLGSAGGGRRLNVLVTRAREEVHLVTSIPREAYRSLPLVPPGMQPTGAWLLFSYLCFAEDLAETYAQASAEHEAARGPAAPVVQVNDSANASGFALALANRLAASGQAGSVVNWGNAGFCVDLALVHPRRSDDVTLGVLCDGSRFGGAGDAVEWDLFRAEILESQGWTLQRLWTPHYFRDPKGSEAKLAKAVGDFLAREIPPDELPVTPSAPDRRGDDAH